MQSLTDLRLVNPDTAADVDQLSPIAECVGLQRLEVSTRRLNKELPNILSVHQIALREITLVLPAVSLHSVCHALNRPPALSRVTLLGCIQIADLLAELTRSLPAAGPLRSLTINPSPLVETTPDDAVIEALMQHLPLLVRFEWELFEIGSLTQMSARAHGYTLYNGVYQRLQQALADARAAGNRWKALDPRIVMVTPRPTLSQLEKDQLLRKRYSK